MRRRSAALGCLLLVSTAASLVPPVSPHHASSTAELRGKLRDAREKTSTIRTQLGAAMARQLFGAQQVGCAGQGRVKPVVQEDAREALVTRPAAVHMPPQPEAVQVQPVPTARGNLSPIQQASVDHWLAQYQRTRELSIQTSRVSSGGAAPAERLNRAPIMLAGDAKMSEARPPVTAAPAPAPAPAPARTQVRVHHVYEDGLAAEFKAERNREEIERFRLRMKGYRA